MTGQIFMSSVADVDFMIHGLFSYELFGHTVWITTSHVCILIVMLTLILFALIANRRIKSATEVPDGFQNVLEMMVEFFDGMVSTSMGKHAYKYRNYIATIFIFIWVSNISGLFGLRPPTADYGTTLALALITFVMIHYNEVKYNSPKDLFPRPRRCRHGCRSGCRSISSLILRCPSLYPFVYLQMCYPAQSSWLSCMAW